MLGEFSLANSGKLQMSRFTKGAPKPANSGIKRGQKQTRTLVKKQVHDLLALSGKHPVTELMKLMPELPAKEQARVWLDLLGYVAPKLSAQSVTIDDQREEQEEGMIDVTPLTEEELIKKAKEGE